MKSIKKGGALLAAFMLTAQTLTMANASADAVCFVLREFGDKIALFEEGVEEPLAVYNTSPDDLYPADAALLREGIRLQSRAEVSRLLEDLDLE